MCGNSYSDHWEKGQKFIFFPETFPLMTHDLPGDERKWIEIRGTSNLSCISNYCSYSYNCSNMPGIKQQRVKLP